MIVTKQEIIMISWQFFCNKIQVTLRLQVNGLKLPEMIHPGNSYNGNNLHLVHLNVLHKTDNGLHPCTFALFFYLIPILYHGFFDNIYKIEPGFFHYGLYILFVLVKQAVNSLHISPVLGVFACKHCFPFNTQNGIHP
jgi:hypothetical protein